MKVSIIVAKAENGIIGKDNTLIWHLPADMKHFRDKTTGHCVITGRKNYESIPEKFRPLPNRTNIVITRQDNYSAPGAIVVNSIEKALELAKEKGADEAFIIGGAEIYRQSLEIADKLYITDIHHAFDGDVSFPEINMQIWRQTKKADHIADEKNKYDYSFGEYEKITNFGKQ